MNYKIINGKLLLHGEDGFKVESGTLFIKDGIISGIRNEGGNTDPDGNHETIDAKDRLVMPGLINAHTHVYMTLLRNYADDVDFGEWLFNRCMPVEDSLPAEAAYWTNLLGFAEMFRSGTTSYVDMHMYKCMSGKAANDAGIRAFIGRGLVGTDLYGDGLSRFREALAEKEEYENSRIRFILSPHAPYSCSEKLYRQVVEESEKRGLLRQTHLSEGLTEVENILEQTGKTPVKWLYDIGFLSDKTLLAHCVQMRDDDIELIAKSRASVVTNPASNAKLGNGFAPVSEMDAAGVHLCLGTDGTSSNNTLNMFREMGLLSLIHKGIQKDSTAAPAQKVLAAATVNAAEALGRAYTDNENGRAGQASPFSGHEEPEQASRACKNSTSRHTPLFGVIEPGAKADLIFLDLKSPSLFPNNNIVSSLCYSANGSEVESVMIDGQFVMRNRELLTIDYERVCYEVQKIADEYLK